MSNEQFHGYVKLIMALYDSNKDAEKVDKVVMQLIPEKERAAFMEAIKELRESNSD